MAKRNPAKSLRSNSEAGLDRAPVQNGIGVLDFGGQYSHLICRRVRALGVYASLLRYDTSMNRINELGLAGLILSGGPSSVYDTKAPKPDKQVFDSRLPVLGICYGYQLLVQAYGGEVKRSQRREYGRATLEILDHASLFAGVDEDKINCWMSHSDSPSRLPPEFTVLAVSDNSPYAAARTKTGNRYGVQFHPEVVQTEYGDRILSSFVLGICKAEKNWDMTNFVQESVKRLSSSISGKVVCGVSGGVDSSVTAALLHKAIGDNLRCVFIDHGLLREGESSEVLNAFREELRIPIAFVDASERFLRALKGVKDAEGKRRVIGKTFAEVFEEFARSDAKFKYLAQGTLYPDVIESGQSASPASTIKTHHNVGGLPKDLSLEVIEPLRELYKDEVREVGRLLGLPDRIIERHPFPGPGLAVRIVGEVTLDKLRICRQSNHIVEETLREGDLYRGVWQAFAYVGDDMITGVLGDERRLGHQVTVKVVESVDAMTADWTRVPNDVLERISTRVTNEVEGVVSVAYSISSKPPATIEPQ